MVPSLLTDSVTYDLERAVHYALLWGLEGIELRRVGGVHDRVPFVNEQKLKRRVRESELSVVAVNPGIFEGTIGDRAAWLNELSELDETLQFCGRIGCGRVVVSTFGREGEEAFERAADALRIAGRKAERAGILLCAINEREYVAQTGSELARLLDAVDLDAVRAAWDPAAAVQSDEDAAAGLAAVARRVEIVRCRNGRRTRNGWEPRSIDHGEIDWSSQIRSLARAGFDGPLSFLVDVEPVGPEGLRGASELIRLLRAADRDVEQGTP